MLELILRGGFFIWPIILCSVISLFLIIERFIFITAKQTPLERLWEASKNDLIHKNTSHLLVDLKKLKGSIPKFLAALIKSDSYKPQVREQYLSQIVANELRRLDTNVHIIEIIARITPLLGLLGTVTGMIKAFMEIQAAGGVVDPDALAGGIWEAMLTTAAGLIVAIPTLIVHGILQKHIDNILDDIEELKNRYELLYSIKDKNIGDEI